MVLVTWAELLWHEAQASRWLDLIRFDRSTGIYERGSGQLRLSVLLLTPDLHTPILRLLKPGI